MFFPLQPMYYLEAVVISQIFWTYIFFINNYFKLNSFVRKHTLYFSFLKFIVPHFMVQSLPYLVKFSWYTLKMHILRLLEVLFNKYQLVDGIVHIFTNILPICSIPQKSVKSPVSLMTSLFLPVWASYFLVLSTYIYHWSCSD